MPEEIKRTSPCTQLVGIVKNKLIRNIDQRGWKVVLVRAEYLH